MFFFFFCVCLRQTNLSFGSKLAQLSQVLVDCQQICSLKANINIKLEKQNPPACNIYREASWPPQKNKNIMNNKFLDRCSLCPARVPRFLLQACRTTAQL